MTSVRTHETTGSGKLFGAGGMSLSGSVLIALGSGLAKWLAKRYLNDANFELTGELVDGAKENIPDLIKWRNAARQFDRFADEIH